MEVQAFAKLNLTLDVLSKRPDGYHDLRMIMQSVTLADRLTLEETGAGEVRVRTDLGPLDEAWLDNMLARLEEGVVS